MHYRGFTIAIICLIVNDLCTGQFEEVSCDINNGYEPPADLGGRLSQDVLPDSYVIAVSPDFIKNEFYASIQINLRIRKERNYIALHTKDLVIASAQLHEARSPRERILVESVCYADKYEMILVRTAGRMATGEYFLRMNFSGRLTGRTSGLYLSTYGNFEYERDRKLLVTQFEPAYARTAFPCFDEPSFKAVFHIRLVHSARSHYRALSNMPISKVASATSNSDTVITYFAPTPPMSTYLVAFVLSDFECLTSSIGSSSGKEIPLSVCTRAVYRNEVRFALRFAARALKYYSDLLRIDYHLPKLDLVAVPDFAAGAMENWGLVTFREAKLLRDGARTSYADMRSIALTVAHELAHMWFGDSVTMKWWNDLWLSEGFATYMQHRAVDSIFPAWRQVRENLSQD
ncbi:Leucyl-cystinyl aminopeptidase [Harpegnathos saltator]|uniref:Leucyl-cystinyl aminopeptidase n=1 Tax=Harpegnathos saltator TaxID=610380 RepID=E2BDX7_HARSA|nr:Leucyl-cystinyl aminopeptidase [Harpegnathos saltator]